MSGKTIYLHMGLHKTGTTSIQKWLQLNSELLRENGFSFFQGKYIPENHIEFGLSSLRDELDAPIKKRFEIDREIVFEETKERINDFLSKSEESRIIISNETMSFIRHEFEMERLQSLFPISTKIVPIIFLRTKDEWLESFSQQIKKVGISESRDARSCSYFEPNTWLLQHDLLVELTRRTFGDCRIAQYNGASLKQFLSIIGLDFDGEEIRLNVTLERKPNSRLSRIYSKAKKRFGI